MSILSTAQTPPQKWRPGIRIYLILMNLILLCLLFPTITIFFFGEISSLRDAQLDRTIITLRQGLEGRAVSLARSLSLSAEQAISGYDYTFLNSMMSQVVGNDQEILYALVMGDKGQVMAHNQADMMGSTLSDDLAVQARAIMAKSFTHLSTDTPSPDKFRFTEGCIIQDGQQITVLEVIMPIHSGMKLAGVMRCGFSLERLSTETDRVKKEWASKMAHIKFFLMSITAVFFLIGVVVAAFFTRFFVRSTTILSEGVHQIASGDLNSEIPGQLMFCREFEIFATAFNKMTSQLRASLHKLDEYSRSLEHKVQERTRALKEAQEELLQQAHEAGMAEMAVGVLHNIGNAITPAKVDASLLIRHFRDSPIRRGLKSISAEIIEALNNPDKIASSEKARLLEITTLLPLSIKEEYNHAITELHGISARHEHIEGIINLQMRYAKLIGRHEEVNLNRVVDDALKMLNESIKQRGIEVEKHLEKISLIKIEQAKMIQIVINLIKNGYEAMDMADLPERRLTVSTFMDTSEPPQVIFSVKDTGCGFTSEEKEKMFRFGYTTKQTGSGFGLHSCANFMIANNGSLSATSEGKCKGAEFMVSFPGKYSA